MMQVLNNIFGIPSAMAAPIDYASTSQAITDATSGLGSTLITGSLSVVGIALGVWGLFFLVGKLRKITK